MRPVTAHPNVREVHLYYRGVWSGGSSKRMRPHSVAPSVTRYVTPFAYYDRPRGKGRGRSGCCSLSHTFQRSGSYTCCIVAQHPIASLAIRSVILNTSASGQISVDCFRHVLQSAVAMGDWQDEIEIDVGADPTPLPTWNHGVPFCNEHCPYHDGKRCQLIGQRPGHLCEPCVQAMGSALTAHEEATRD